MSNLKTLHEQPSFREACWGTQRLLRGSGSGFRVGIGATVGFRVQDLWFSDSVKCKVLDLSLDLAWALDLGLYIRFRIQELRIKNC